MCFLWGPHAQLERAWCHYAAQSFMSHLINGSISNPPALSSRSYTLKKLSQNLSAEPSRRQRCSPNIQKNGFKTLATPVQPKTLILKKYLIPWSLMRVKFPTRAHAALLWGLLTQNMCDVFFTSWLRLLHEKSIPTHYVIASRAADVPTYPLSSNPYTFKIPLWKQMAFCIQLEVMP